MAYLEPLGRSYARGPVRRAVYASLFARGVRQRVAGAVFEVGPSSVSSAITEFLVTYAPGMTYRDLMLLPTQERRERVPEALAQYKARHGAEEYERVLAEAEARLPPEAKPNGHDVAVLGKPAEPDADRALRFRCLELAVKTVESPGIELTPGQVLKLAELYWCFALDGRKVHWPY